MYENYVAVEREWGHLLVKAWDHRGQLTHHWFYLADDGKTAHHEAEVVHFDSHRQYISDGLMMCPTRVVDRLERLGYTVVDSDGCVL